MVTSSSFVPTSIELLKCNLIIELILEHTVSDIWLLHHVLSYLEKEGKAELMLGDSEDFSDAGVKFF